MPIPYKDYVPQQPVIMSEEKTRDFTQRVNRYSGLIYYIIRTYGRIESRSDQDDFYQEALVSLFTAFHKYDPCVPGTSFTAWLGQVVKYSILNYRLYYYRISRWTSYVEDMGEFSHIPDELPKTDNYELVKMAINRLASEDRIVLEMFKRDDSLRANSLNEGHFHGYYSKKFQNVCQKIRYEIHGKPPRKTKKNTSRSKPVCRMNMAGEILEVYPSVMEAGRSGFNAKNIHKVVSGKRHTAGGYCWKYTDQD
jgi:RNA polymerase sigma factor (sigma-70 family)